MLKVAVATNDGEHVAGGHFAHAKKFRIYEFNPETGEIKFLEERENPLGRLPDFDNPHEAMEVMNELNIPLHGIPKYNWLKENVLPDVDVVLCGGACQTSYQFFMSEGVVVLFDEPGNKIENSMNVLKEVVK